MAGAYIDFARLNPPQAFESLDYEAQLAAAIAKLQELLPDWDVANIESDPANKILEVTAYQDLLRRARINDAIKSMLLAYATGADLDQLGANVNVERLSGETDARLRERVQQGLWAYTAVGNPSAYRYHAMSAGTDVLDAATVSPSPGRVDVIALAAQWVTDATEEQERIGSALFPDLVRPENVPDQAVPVMQTSSDATLSAVRSIVTADDVAPLTDDVHVLAPIAVEVPVTATLHLLPGPDQVAVLNDALAALENYRLAIRSIGRDCTRAGIIDALVVSGVRAVALSEPAADVIINEYSVAALTPIAVDVSESRSV